MLIRFKALMALAVITSIYTSSRVASSKTEVQTLITTKKTTVNYMKAEVFLLEVEKTNERSVRPFDPEPGKRKSFENMCNLSHLQKPIDWLNIEIATEFCRGKGNPQITAKTLSLLFKKSIEIYTKYIVFMNTIMLERLEMMAFTHVTTRVKAMILYVVRVLGEQESKFPALVDQFQDPKIAAFLTDLRTRILDSQSILALSEVFLIELLIIWEDCSEDEPVTDNKPQLDPIPYERPKDNPPKDIPKKDDKNIRTVVTQTQTSGGFAYLKKHTGSLAYGGGKYTTQLVKNKYRTQTTTTTYENGRLVDQKMTVTSPSSFSYGQSILGNGNSRFSSQRTSNLYYSPNTKSSSGSSNQGQSYSNPTTYSNTYNSVNYAGSLGGKSSGSSSNGQNTINRSSGTSYNSVNNKGVSNTIYGSTNNYGKKKYRALALNKDGSQSCGKSIEDLRLYHEKTFTARIQGYTTSSLVKLIRQDYFKSMLSLHQTLCVVLQTIVMTYSGHPRLAATYSKLKSKPMPSISGIQTEDSFIRIFYQQFYYVLTDYRPDDCVSYGAKTLRAAITLSFIGADIDDPNVFLHRMFFSQAFFAYVLKVQVNAEIIEYDKFIIQGLPGKADLSVLEGWVKKKVIFHVEFLNEFNKHYHVKEKTVEVTINDSIIADLFNLRTQPQPEREALDSFILAVYLLIYKIYVQLRAEGKLIQTMTKTQIFEVIFTWLTSQDYKWTNTKLYKSYFTYLELSYYYGATISYVCVQINCEGTAKEKLITDSILETLNIKADTNPKLIIDRIYFIKRLRDWFNRSNSELKIRQFGDALIGLDWEGTLAGCPKSERERPFGETGEKFQDKKEIIISFTRLCTQKLYLEFVTLLKLHITITLEFNIVRMMYEKFRHFMDNNTNFNIRGLARYLLIAWIRYLYINVSERNKKPIHPVFIKLFYYDYVAKSLQNLYMEGSWGFYSYFSAVLLPTQFQWTFRLTVGQEETVYNDIYHLVYYPLVFGPTMDEAMRKAEIDYVRAEVKIQFEQIPTPKKVSFDSFKAARDAIADPAKAPADTDYYSLVSYLATVDLMIDHLDFYNFCSKYHAYGKALNAAEAFAPYTALTTFYHLLYKVRISMDTEVVNSYRYFLERLESCLKYTSGKIVKVKDPTLESVCHLSYRKYAELYFLYKTYLMTERGYEDLSYQNYDQTLVPLRTGTFFRVAVNVPTIGMHIDNQCKQEGSDIAVVCQVWGALKPILLNIKSVSPIGFTFKDLMTLIAAEFNIEEDQKPPFTREKIKLLVLYDALNSAMRQLPYQNDIFVGIFDHGKELPVVNGVPDTSTVAGRNRIWILEDLPDEKRMLADFLMLNYKKRFIEASEHCSSVTVKAILASIRSTKVSKSGKIEADSNSFSLNTLLTYQGIHSIGLLKFFMMYSDSIEDFMLYPDYLISRKIFLQIVNVEGQKVDEETKDVNEKMKARCKSIKDPSSSANVQSLILYLREIIKTILEETYTRSVAQIEFSADPFDVSTFQVETPHNNVQSNELFDAAMLNQVTISLQQDTAFQKTIQQSINVVASTEVKVVIQEISIEEINIDQVANIERKTYEKPTVVMNNESGIHELPNNFQTARIDSDSKQVTLGIHESMSQLTGIKSVQISNESSMTEQLAALQNVSIEFDKAQIFMSETSFSMVKSTTIKSVNLSKSISIVGDLSLKRRRRLALEGRI